MAEGDCKNWRGLCDAGLEAKGPHELLKIIQEVNEALKHEEQARRGSRWSGGKSPQEIRC
jgi:hypothetical protein